MRTDCTLFKGFNSNCLQFKLWWYQYQFGCNVILTLIFNNCKMCETFKEQMSRRAFHLTVCTCSPWRAFIRVGFSLTLWIHENTEICFTNTFHWVSIIVAAALWTVHINEKRRLLTGIMHCWCYFWNITWVLNWYEMRTVTDAVGSLYYLDDLSCFPSVKHGWIVPSLKCH